MLRSRQLAAVARLQSTPECGCFQDAQIESLGSFTIAAVSHRVYFSPLAKDEGFRAGSRIDQSAAEMGSIQTGALSGICRFRPSFILF